MVSYIELILFAFLGSVVSMAAGFLLLKNKASANKLAKYAMPFAAGALLAAVFLDLLPEGLEVSSSKTVLISTLAGLLIFFYLERFITWFHRHDHNDAKKSSTKNLVIIGDTLHNALDGVVIASAFLIEPSVGLVATIAVAAHEIPQEIGDFGLLLAMGMKKKKVILVNLASALSTIVAAVFTYWLGGQENLPIGVMLGLSAGLLLYIATSDIMPSIHKESQHKSLLDIRPFLLIFGVAAVALIIALVEQLDI